MRSIVKYIAIPAVVLAAACQSKEDPKLDDALSKDLALASQVQPYQPQQFVSPMEQAYGQNPAAMQYAPQGYNPYYQPAPQRVVYRTAPTARRSSSGGGYSSGTVYRAPTVQKHTKRDAAIGAAAGAIIGASTSRDKVKGGLIGAAAGGILGGIIGHTVDVEK